MVELRHGCRCPGTSPAGPLPLSVERCRLECARNGRRRVLTWTGRGHTGQDESADKSGYLTVRVLGYKTHFSFLRVNVSLLDYKRAVLTPLRYVIFVY